MRDTLTNMFQKDWMSAEKLELISCLIAEKYKQKLKPRQISGIF